MSTLALRDHRARFLPKRFASGNASSAARLRVAVEQHAGAAGVVGKCSGDDLFAQPELYKFQVFIKLGRR